MSRNGTLNNYNYVSSNPEAIQHTEPNRILLSVRQQPVQARSSTNNERDRRPVDPPPIVQIELNSSNGQELQHFLQNPFLFMSVSLVDPSTLEQVTSSSINTVSGQTTSSMYKLKDINNQDGGFFVFGDLSVKLEGKFRLKFSMFEINDLGATNLKTVYSDPFQVYPSKSFPGMLESTFLSRSFSDQGARIRIRKEHRVQMVSSRKRKTSPGCESLDQAHQNKIEYPSNQYDHSTVLTGHPYHTQNQPIYSPHRIYQENEQRRHKEIMVHKREGLASPLTSGLQTCIPFSPPHQHYDPYLVRAFTANANYYHHHQLVQNSFLSPPPQSTSFQKHDPYRRSSYDERTSDPLKRTAGDSRYLMPNNQRRMSLQPCSHSPFLNYPVGKGPIHLPPLRSVVPTAALDSPPYPARKRTGEVDAAVAMMQLASLKKPRKTELSSLW
ncbi:hypothetical protein CU098_003025 [Rhizopus stolonifer]|uniref:Velvet domain-containing protein n=1 Tax=Rhizopus stolonifer TaxID=4846 RepID=A0A367IWW4_RHIST|nr:hypothetical protein CU098_003025 [Rhizopus stolonifer]